MNVTGSLMVMTSHLHIFCGHLTIVRIRLKDNVENYFLWHSFSYYLFDLEHIGTDIILTNRIE